MSFNHKCYYVVSDFRSVTSIYDLYSLFYTSPIYKTKHIYIEENTHLLSINKYNNIIFFVYSTFFCCWHFCCTKGQQPIYKVKSSGWSTRTRDWQLMWTFVTLYTLELWHKTWLNGVNHRSKTALFHLFFTVKEHLLLLFRFNNFGLKDSQDRNTIEHTFE